MSSGSRSQETHIKLSIEGHQRQITNKLDEFTESDIKRFALSVHHFLGYPVDTRNRL